MGKTEGQGSERQLTSEQVESELRQRYSRWTTECCGMDMITEEAFVRNGLEKAFPGLYEIPEEEVVLGEVAA